jgi:DNA-binding response OmpR family regulator
MRILVIEDDQKLAALIARALTRDQHNVDVFHDGDSGLEAALKGASDVAIIDWMLPGRDGPAICRAIRAARLRTAGMLLTARGQVEDRVAGLDAGADDYLTKPFALEELLARTRALGRRFTPALSGGDELRCGDLVLDTIAHTARVGVTALDLTATEWSLLEYLARHRGQALTRDQILDYVWSYDRAVQTSMVDLYISYLRRKLNTPEADCSGMIQTVRGLGYRLDVVE